MDSWDLLNGIYLRLLADTSKPIFITAGEGEIGTTKLYTGKRTIRALKLRLTKERCKGDRWARAKVYSHTNDYGDQFWVFEL